MVELLLVAIVAFYGQTVPASQPVTIEQLRTQFEVRFMEAEPHMAFARYFKEHQQPLMAFRILEAARRHRFDPDTFNLAFEHFFLGKEPFDPSPENEKQLLDQLGNDPHNKDLLFRLADIYISREDWPKAEEYLTKRIENDPNAVLEIEGLVEVYHQQEHPEKADQFIADHMRRFPDSRISFMHRIQPLMKQQDWQSAQPLLEQAIGKYPDDGEFAFNFGIVLQHLGELEKARESFVQAATLSPDEPYIQGWVGRFFLKALDDPTAALPYYFQAYFHDPDFYETEHAEERIATIAGEQSEATLLKELAGGTSLAALASGPNPKTASGAIARMADDWKAEYADSMVECLRSDDEGVRAAATETLVQHTDAAFDERIRVLLHDPDVRARGCAAYIACHHWKDKSFPLMREMLKSDVQLLRFDAISALLQYGGEQGRQIVREHGKNEPNASLRDLIQSTISGD